MKAIALIPLFMAAVILAADTSAPELDRLKTSYKAAVAKATKPLLQSHIAILEKLRDIYTRAANLDGANKVQADIDRANVAMAMGEFNPPAADSNNATAPELDKLRAGHDAEIERVVKPYRETYVRELDKLRENYTRSSNLAGANAVQAELTSLKPGGGTSKAAELQAAGKQPRLSGKAPKSEWYLGKTWASDKGTQWTFAKGGGGEVTHTGGKKVPLSWSVEPSGVIKLRHEASTSKDVSTWYVTFLSPVEGLYGAGPKDLEKTIRLKQ